MTSRQNQNDGARIIEYHEGMFDDGRLDRTTMPHTEPDRNRRLTIWSWGKNMHKNPECALTIDLVSFHSEYEKRDIRNADGRDPELQAHMQSHCDFAPLMHRIVQRIEDQDIQSVAFVCSWGKHRSMAFAEMLKYEYYPRAKLKHARLKAHAPREESGRRNREAKKKNRQPRYV